jgi:bacillithiol synthase
MSGLRISQIETIDPGAPVTSDDLAALSRGFSGSAHLQTETVSQVIARQNTGFPPPSADTAYIVAGQQAGLLTGPLYTFLKAASAVRLARLLSETASRQILPLFWIAGEDHDLLEVNRITIGGRRFVHEYGGDLSRGIAPQVGTIPLLDQKAPLLDFLAQNLLPTEYTGTTLDMIAAADFTNYTSAFKSLLQALFSSDDLRVLDPLESRALTSKVLSSLVARWPVVIEGLKAGQQQQGAAGDPAPLSSARIYEIVDGRRVPIDLDERGGLISEGHLSLEELAKVILRRGDDFSPSAALRPLCQDGALPVMATLGGPTELHYLRQILPIYDRFDITPSARLSRISATFISPGIGKAVRKAGLSPADLLAHGRDHSEQSDGPSDPRLTEIETRGQALLEALDRLDTVESPRWLRSGRSSIEKGIGRVTSGLRDQSAEELGRSRKQLARIAEAIRPGGKPQERVINIFELINRYGPDFIPTVLEVLDPIARGHQLVYLASGEEK